MITSRNCRQSVQLIDGCCEVSNVSFMDYSMLEVLFDHENCIVLGQGIYGKCFLARMHLSKWVLKVIPDVPVNVKGMLNEMRALSALQDCPGIQQLVMVCPAALAMISEYGGEPLDKYLAGHSCSDSQRVDMALQLTNTLISIHQKGWTHLDVKSDNVTVCASQSGPQVTLIDFGLGAPVGRRYRFKQGAVNKHMAPEVFAGRPCSPESDVYSMAWLLPLLVIRPGPQLERWVRQGFNVDPRQRQSLADLSKILKGLKNALRR